MSLPTITPFNLGMLSADLAEWFGLPPGHPYAGRVDRLPIWFYLVGLPGRLILLDPPAYEFPGESSMLLPEFNGRTAAALLANAGVGVAAVTDVVITHPHLDHTLGLVTRPASGPSTPVFSNTRHYLSLKDWENLVNMDEVERQPIEVVRRAGLLTLVEGERDLGDGLALFPIPGETPGHQALRLQTADDETWFTGDLFHHPLELEDVGVHPVWADAQTMQASKSMLAQRAAQSGARVFFTHIDGAYRLVESGGQRTWKKIA